MKFLTIRSADPFQRPEWRLERALTLVESGRRCGRNDDRYVRDYVNFRRRYDSAADQAARDKIRDSAPELYYAHQIFERAQAEPEMAHIMEARLLARTPFRAISSRLKTYTETVRWYERLFFNVADRLRHSDWILKQVLLPAYDRLVNIEEQHRHQAVNGPAPAPAKRPPVQVMPHFDWTLKFFAYFGGPLTCDFVITGFQKHRNIKSIDEIKDYFNEQYKLAMSCRSAQLMHSVELTRYNAMELFALNSRMMEIHQSGKSTEERRNDIAKNVSAFMTEMPWLTGRNAALEFEGKLIGEYDQSPAEVDADEALQAGLGNRIAELDAVKDRNVFAERQRGQESHASAK